MYLKLYADAVVEIPCLEFDPVLLDEVLSDLEIDRLSMLIAMDDRQRGDVVTHIKLATEAEIACKADHPAGCDRAGMEELPDCTLAGGLPTSNSRLILSILEVA
jgi:hypothetical protein